MQPFESISVEEAKRVRFVLCDIDDTLTTDGRLTAEAYSALWSLADAGYQVIPVTGRPAGWCDMIVRQWPVPAVIGENGALVFYNWSLEGPRIFRHPSAPADAQQRLAAVRDAVLAAVPGSRIARDQFSRIYDLAIDYNEDDPHLPLSAAEEIRRVCEEQGANAKISSIHVNAWFGDYDKLAMTELFFLEVMGVDPFEETIYFGDSPNDEPMFKAFPLSCAMANIAPFAAGMKHLPKYVAGKPGGAGFAEAAAHLIKLSGGRA